MLIDCRVTILRTGVVVTIDQGRDKDFLMKKSAEVPESHRKIITGRRLSN